MSPSHRNPKKRRRLILAALTANGAGTVAGAATQAAIGDPAISALAGSFIAGIIGDLLLQVARTRNESPPDELRTTEHNRRHQQDGRARRRELGDVHGRVGGARPGHGRCTGNPRQGPVVGAPQVPRPPGSVTPRHLRHRQLHRGAQRFARRVHERHAVQQPHGGTHGAA